MYFSVKIIVKVSTIRRTRVCCWFAPVCTRCCRQPTREPAWRWTGRRGGLCRFLREYTTPTSGLVFWWSRRGWLCDWSPAKSKDTWQNHCGFTGNNGRAVAGTTGASSNKLHLRSKWPYFYFLLITFFRCLFPNYEVINKKKGLTILDRGTLLRLDRFFLWFSPELPYFNFPNLRDCLLIPVDTYEHSLKYLLFLLPKTSQVHWKFSRNSAFANIVAPARALLPAPGYDAGQGTSTGTFVTRLPGAWGISWPRPSPFWWGGSSGRGSGRPSRLGAAPRPMPPPWSRRIHFRWCRSTGNPPCWCRSTAHTSRSDRTQFGFSICTRILKGIYWLDILYGNRSATPPATRLWFSSRPAMAVARVWTSKPSLEHDRDPVTTKDATSL